MDTGYGLHGTVEGKQVQIISEIAEPRRGHERHVLHPPPHADPGHVCYRLDAGSLRKTPKHSCDGESDMMWVSAFPFFFFSATFLHPGDCGNRLRAAKRLYDDLLSDYNRLIRPVSNISDKLTVHLGLKLSQLIDVNLRNQIMTTNVWVEQQWIDYKLSWDPNEYGGVQMLYVPSEHIWLPDIVLYNKYESFFAIITADGNYEVTLMTKATLKYTGEVEWKPPAIYKSSCEMDVEWFPFDEQSCTMKFGSWTYNGFQVDLKHKDQNPGSNIVPIGINLKEFYKSVEWDLLEVPAQRNEEYFRDEEFFPAMDVPYPDITFNVTLRRKTLFYTVNLIVPCVGISFLTVLVFYLPADSGEKVSLCISILVSLTVFFLLLAEIIPPTSLAVPLLGKYLLFTMILVTLSIYVTVCVLNVHFRRSSTHKMSPWVKQVFIDFMPRLLLMRRPEIAKHRPLEEELKYLDYGYNELDFRDSYMMPRINGPGGDSSPLRSLRLGIREELYHQTGEDLSSSRRNYSPDILRAIEGVQFIAQHIKDDDEYNEVQEEWKYVAMVLDRLFLWVFTIACVVGTCGIILMAPSLYDTRAPIDTQLSDIGRSFEHFAV
ncbi:unnamed protein product [Darwinula stevensoni]|uniref:Acetylcholine receptor subunit beta-like 2 n=1 Tax=Darwinula stevensoni TaxID=69355 RepID=A0A7R8XDC7_9CRUS|nr:unnamed protein product [Darwinula stevensoni]CAG0894178.1 unnamed protein product [Darwinula stevensoni]